MGSAAEARHNDMLGRPASPWFPEGQPEPLVLASRSPRRIELLEQIGLRFIQSPQDTDERPPPGAAPREAVEMLALRKALAAHEHHQDAVILGADTMVVVDGETLGKPADDDEAFRMLRRLGGRSHDVVTGIAIRDGGAAGEMTASESTRVTMRRATDAEIGAYIATGEPHDKAGAYGIQGYGAGLVTRVEGCYFNVVGLPIHRVIECLRHMMTSR